MEGAAAVNTDNIKNAGGRKSEREDAGVVDAVKTGGEHQKEERSKTPTGGADDVPNEIAAEGGGGWAICGTFCHVVPF